MASWAHSIFNLFAVLQQAAIFHGKNFVTILVGKGLARKPGEGLALGLGGAPLPAAPASDRSLDGARPVN